MSKVKRILAVVLTMAMMMAMSVVSFATEENTAKITVNGLTDGVETTVNAYKVAVLDAEGSRWQILGWAEPYVTKESDGTYTFDWAQLKEHKPGNADATATSSGTTAVLTVDEIGAYLITADDADSNITYGAMGVETAGYGSDGLMILEDAAVNAKPETIKVIKTIKLEDGTEVNKQVAVGDTITYDITTTFPSFDSAQTDRTFKITDTPGAGLRIDGIAVTVGGSSFTDYTLDPTSLAGIAAGTAVEVNFNATSLADSANNAGKRIVVTVTATVMSEDNITNTATSTNDSTGSTVTSYTSEATVTKTDDNATNPKPLEGAKFVLTTVIGNATKYAKLDADKTFVEWVDSYKDEDDVLDEDCIVTTGTDGTATVKGLDADLTYKFVEVVAPKGYSVNENDHTVAWNEVPVDELGNAAGGTTGAVTVTDTVLSALPSTGGAGIIVFTIVGCLIMIAAATMFFLSGRKKEE